MLPDNTVPRSLNSLLLVFRPGFTAPTFDTFTAMVVGLIAQTRRRTVCGMLLGVGLQRAWHHARAHRFFATARWCADALGLLMLDLIVARLLPADSAITVAIDDTLFKRTGKKVFGVFWHHDGAAKGPKPIGFGNCWVAAGVIVALPLLPRPVCLPVLARLWRPRQTGKLTHARAMVELIANRYPDRAIHAVGDAAYIGDHLRGLGEKITWTSRLKVTSVLHQLAPPRTGRSGRPRTKGPRLGTPTDLAATATWRRTQLRRYGRVDTVWITEITCLWYGAFRGQTVRVVLVRDDKPHARDRDDRGYGLPLVTTDLHTSAERMVTRYAWRWAIEVAFSNARQVLGVGQARNRTRQAVARTVPFGLLCLSLVAIWYATAGHSPSDVTERRSCSRWYLTKTEPSFEDMTIKLRRVIIAAKYRPQGHHQHYQPTPEETQIVLAAWAAAET
jgi:hypothetical protein